MSAKNVANLTAEERAQFRSIAARVNTAPFDFDLLQEAMFRTTLSALLVSDDALAVGPALINSTPLDVKVKNALFAMFEQARQKAQIVTGGAGDLGNVFVAGSIGVIVGIALGWVVGR